MLTPGAMVMVKVAVAELVAESVTVTPKLGVPVAVGLPPSNPEVDSVRPVGSAEPLATAQV
jgi:hypothetical protein